ncbi:hypothetical protein BBP07_06070 [Citrobacter koseri]|uniref:Uncharacterized protein n=1 Tax=Citrobacter koseri TaxID=545 RepID=A0A078LDJ2_CITKO|nr:hypothetical protein BBP07_06070 [Citrobacter koseri]CDZ83297.1 hypothetical protein BN1086_01411 [Citrobacter koseri]STA79333.1 Uncharacterised protein [Citrobacter koseri]STB30836.1 Uncharacterised protein [Citrobacter koseri]STT21649.1 Uncharacterised protein [Citrobacter koseri]
MNTLKFTVLWHIYLLSYACIFIAFFAVVPEQQLFTWLSNKYGFIDIEKWDIYYSLFTLLTTALLNSLFIIITFRLVRKNSRANNNY